MPITVFKPYGMTPKELVDECVAKHGAKKGAFSGRLDPMACGVTKVYFDDECKLANECDKLDKTYRFVMVLGISSSSYDLLGFPKLHLASEKPNEVNVGEMIQKQPIHSSFIVKNKEGVRNPLWWWALNNRLDEITIPSFQRVLHELTIKRVFKLSLADIKETAITRIGLINPRHNFRQTEIINAWNALEDDGCRMYEAYEMEARVSSGFYIRQLVNDMCSTAITLEIERLSYS